MTIVLRPEDGRVTWILGPAFVVAFLLAFSVGANDVSNSFGTSVGSGVLTVTQACILATIFEVAGSTMLGHSVCNFFRRNMYRVELYKGSEQDLMIGALGCLVGSALWNLIATKLKMPISGTHSVIGATIGFNLVLRGVDSVQWKQLIKVVSSWFISPILSGLISSAIYLIISKSIIAKGDPLKNGLKALPMFYGATIFINVAALVITSDKQSFFGSVPWYGGLFLALVACALVIIFSALVLVPRIRNRINEELKGDIKRPKKSGPKELQPKSESYQLKEKPLNCDKEIDQLGHDNSTFTGDTPNTPDTPEKQDLCKDSKTEGLPDSVHRAPQLQRQLARDVKTEDNTDIEELDKEKKKKKMELPDIESNIKPICKPPNKTTQVVKFIEGERIEIHRIFSSLQILTACFASFAHGTNDVSNAVAPLVPIWNVWLYGHENLDVSTQSWILLFGGIGICSGLWAWGRAVIRTVGTGLTRLTPSKGFAIELGAAISVLFASKAEIPVSTTHCKVGSLVILGLVSERFCSRDYISGLTLGRRASTSQLDEMLASQAELGPNKVDWKLFGNIALTWIVTVPLAAIASVLTTLVLRSMIPNLEDPRP